MTVKEEEGKIYVEVEMPESFLKLHTEIMGTHNLGITRISEQAFENADGSEIRLDADYFGCGRSASPTPGPFEGLNAGYHKICVYENNF
jgi:hypothetical protein